MWKPAMILPGMEIRLTSLLLSEFCCSFFADEHMINLFLQLSPYLLVIMQKLFQLIFINPLLGFGLSFFILKYLRNAFILLLLVHVSTSHMFFFIKTLALFMKKSCVQSSELFSSKSWHTWKMRWCFLELSNSSDFQIFQVLYQTLPPGIPI